VKARLAWAGGGFVLVALLVHRFLTRVPSPDVVPVDAPVAPPVTPPVVRTPAPAPSEPPTALEPLAPVFPFVPHAAAATPPPPPVAPILTLAPAPAEEPEDETAPAGEADGSADIDPDERIEALRRKLEEARGGAAAGEPPLDDRRRSVHDAGRSAAEAMRRTVERPARPEDAAAPAEPPFPADDGPATS